MYWKLCWGFLKIETNWNGFEQVSNKLDITLRGTEPSGNDIFFYVFAILLNINNNKLDIINKINRNNKS